MSAIIAAIQLGAGARGEGVIPVQMPIGERGGICGVDHDEERNFARWKRERERKRAEEKRSESKREVSRGSLKGKKVCVSQVFRIVARGNQGEWRKMPGEVIGLFLGDQATTVSTVVFDNANMMMMMMIKKNVSATYRKRDL